MIEDIQKFFLFLFLSNTAVGILIGFLITENAARKSLITVVGSILRILLKHHANFFKNDGIRGSVSNDKIYDNSDKNSLYRSQMEKEILIKPALDFRNLLSATFHDEIISVHFFGSRACGKFSSFSDLDIAVFYDANYNLSFHTYWEMQRLAFKMLVSHGIYIQTHLFKTDAARDNPLISDIMHNGIRI